MEIKLISQNGCVPCSHVKNLLDSKDVFYDYLNISTDESLIEKYNVMSTPLILVFDGGNEIKRINGFKPNEIQELIAELDS